MVNIGSSTKRETKRIDKMYDIIIIGSELNDIRKK